MHRAKDMREKIETIKTQHRILDDQIVVLETDPTSDQLKIQRLKRQKLKLKDEISRLETSLLPDIIA